MWRFLRHPTRLLRHQGHCKQGYYIKVYQGYYVKVTLTNHRTFQNRPTLDAKKMHFCSSESRESRIFWISALKTIVLKNKTNFFFRPATGQFWNEFRWTYETGAFHDRSTNRCQPSSLTFCLNWVYGVVLGVEFSCVNFSSIWPQVFEL